ncbi:hypothetical protein SKPI104516_02955 [Skermania piniformis]
MGLAAQSLSAPALSNVVTIDVLYHFRPLVLLTAVAALGLTLLGAIPPAVRAARLNIVEAVAAD